MGDFGLHIDDKLYDDIFPFSFILDRGLYIIKAGRSLKKFFGKPEGKSVEEVFTIVRPRHLSFEYYSLVEALQQIIILKSRGLPNELLFRYGNVVLPEKEQIFFIGSPWLTESHTLKVHGLKLRDFANHDAITDLLQVLNMKDMMLAETHKLNAALEESESKYRMVVENAHDLIYYLDPQGFITYVNRVAEEKLGYPNEKLVGMHFSELIHPDHRESVVNFYINARDENLPKTYYEFPVLSRTGEVIWIGQNIHANQDEQGKITAFFSVARDITDQKTLEDNLRSAELRLRKLISNLVSGIIVEDEKRNIVLVNQKFCDIFHISAPPDQLIGMNCSNAAEQSKALFVDPQAFVERIKETLQHKEIIVGDELVMISGQTFERDYIPIFLGNKYLGHLWQYRDVTDKKLAEQKLIDARRYAEAAQEAEKQFLAKMSHEIRTPLNAVVGMSHLLAETSISSEQKEYLNILNSSADLLLKLISDILDLSKIIAGQVDVVNIPFNLKQTLQSLCNSFRVKCAEKDIALSFHYEDEITDNVMGDELLLSQILINLISNAVKFTEKGQIIFSVRLMNDENGVQLLQFSVRDTGIGISQEGLNAIFENFKQANSQISRQYGGTGLGLAIVNQLVQLLGGNIHVSSELGSGSCFVVELPLISYNTEYPTKEITRSSENIDLENLKILIAEDNAMNRKYINRLLQKWGIEHQFAEDGQQVLEALKKERYDLILMDIQMPLMDGYEATRKIRQLRDNPNQEVPIVALTASALTEHKQFAEKAGMNGFISKPFRPEELRKKIIETACMVENISEIHSPDNIKVDRLHIHTIYGDDKEYAIEILRLFLGNIYPEYKTLKNMLVIADNEKARKLLHKIIPSFSMVGLTALEKKLSLLQEMIKGSAQSNVVLDLFNNIDEEIQVAIPALEEEIDLLTNSSN